MIPRDLVIADTQAWLERAVIGLGQKVVEVQKVMHAVGCHQ